MVLTTSLLEGSVSCPSTLPRIVLTNRTIKNEGITTGFSKDVAHPLARAHGRFATEQTDNTRHGPSAESPTETLRRLYLSLSGKVHKTSHDRRLKSREMILPQKW